MRLKFFPDATTFDPHKAEFKDTTGDVGKEMEDLSKRRPDLYLRVRSFLLNLLTVTDLLPYLKNGQIYKFPAEKEGLYEMRIPKQAHSGVFRIYFCHSMTEFQMLILLCAELKHKKKPMKLSNAIDKMKQYRELVKKGIML